MLRQFRPEPEDKKRQKDKHFNDRNQRDKMKFRASGMVFAYCLGTLGSEFNSSNSTSFLCASTFVQFWFEMMDKWIHFDSNIEVCQFINLIFHAYSKLAYLSEDSFFHLYQDLAISVQQHKLNSAVRFASEFISAIPTEMCSDALVHKLIFRLCTASCSEQLMM